jgi:hypothetical protein
MPVEFRNNKKEKTTKEKHLDPRIVKERNEKERKEFFEMINDPNNNTNVKQEDPAFGFELLNLIPGNENDNRPRKRSFSEEKSKSTIKKEKVKPVILHEVKTDKKNNSFMIKPFNSEETCEKEIEEKGHYNFKPKSKVFIEEEDDSPSEDDNFINKPAVFHTVLNTFTSSKTEMINTNSNRFNLSPVFMILLLILILIIWRLFKQSLRLYFQRIKVNNKPVEDAILNDPLLSDPPSINISSNIQINNIENSNSVHEDSPYGRYYNEPLHFNNFTYNLPSICDTAILKYDDYISRI